MPLAQVDHVEVLVLVENTTDILSSSPPVVTGEIARLLQRGISPTNGAAYCHAAHGLSLLITAYGPDGPRTMLFDGGPAAEPLAMNGRRLGVDFGSIGGVVLSHCHWDHVGGLPRALELIRAANRKQPVPLFLHPAMFEQRGFRLAGGVVAPSEPFPIPSQWAVWGADPRVTKEAQTFQDGLFFISGEISRVTSYETGFDQQVRRVAPDAPWEPEPFIVDERFMAVHVRGKGLVVFSGCSHAGIVNVLLHAHAEFPGVPLHAVVGGFHLSGAGEKIIPETVNDLKRLGLDYIITGHCTGWRALNALQDALGDQVILPLAVGKQFSL